MRLSHSLQHLGARCTPRSVKPAFTMTRPLPEFRLELAQSPAHC
jgi:hypothetical protein